MTDTLAPVAREAWLLDRRVRHLNHGSFGACPRAVLAAQGRWRTRMERSPVRFLDRELESHLDAARRRVAAFVGADPESLVFVANATTGVSTVLQSLRFRPGDELLATDHEYNATLNALGRAAARDRAHVRIVRLPVPAASPDEIVNAVLAAVSPRTRLLLVSHVTSPTAIVMPIEPLVTELDRLGVDTLVDGAHAPGMVPLDLDRLGAAWYTGNGHKWCCAPKGAAFLWVRPDRQHDIHPLVTSHGANDARADRPRLWLEFDWSGTDDPTAALAWPAALDAVGAMVAGGWPEVIARNHALAAEAGSRLVAASGRELAAPDGMLGSMAAVTLPVEPGQTAGELQRALVEAGFEVPIVEWPVPAARELIARGADAPGIDSPGRAGRRRRDEARPRVLVRVSAQLYNGIEDYEALAEALDDLVPEDLTPA